MKTPRGFLRALLLVPLLWLSSSSGSAIAGPCPPDFGNGQLCNANDFQVSAELLSGPSECTDGEIFSLTLRVELNSTAKNRYDIGLFAGDSGEPVISGQSCSFSSLVPLEPVFNANSGTGPYRNLDSDACGDVDKGDGPVYRDFPLDQVLCRDNDGDGRVDIAGLVTWSSNATQDICTDPADPTNFFPQQSTKCQLAPHLNLPIIVEPTPSMLAAKIALPENLPAPGGSVDFQAIVVNSSASTDTLMLTSLVDDIHGDLDGRGTCSLPQELSPGEHYFCRFTGTVLGPSGYSEADTLTATAEDDEGNPLTASDTATVTIADEPASLQIFKDVAPKLVPEPGGMVTYTVTVINTSDTESITVDSLVDDIYGDIFNVTACTSPHRSITLAPGEYFTCAFTKEVTGQPGDVITDIVTATATGPGGASLTSTGTASVEIVEVPATILVRKIAVPQELPEPGGPFTFQLHVKNTSRFDTVTLNSMTDLVGEVSTDILTIAGTTCVLPQVLTPGGLYECGFDDTLTGGPGDYRVDRVFVSGTDDDGNFVSNFGAAEVFISDVPAEIEVVKTAHPTVINSGDTVSFSVSVTNVSATDSVTIFSLSDDIYGDITQVQGDIQNTSCSVSQVLAPDATYTCTFDAVVTATAPLPAIITDTVTASGTDDETPANPVSSSDSAEVEVVAIPPPPPDDIEVVKLAIPKTLATPGGNVRYLVLVYNPSANAIRVTNLLDNVYDIQGNDPSKQPVSSASNCTTDIDIAAGGLALCSFVGEVNGDPGDVITDTVTAQACVPPNCATPSLSDSASASVSITPGPASIAVSKTVSPLYLAEPGGSVTFSVEVQNTSADTIVTIASLADDVYGDLNGRGDCAVPQVLQPPGNPGDTYLCSFTVNATGVDGDRLVDIVTASGNGANGDPASAQDDATVVISGSPPAIEIIKTASPPVLEAPGGPVTFTVTLTNPSNADTLTVSQLTDDVYGNLDGQGDCALPQVLGPSAQYSCRFTAEVIGTAPSFHEDTITVVVHGSDDRSVSGQDNAFVLIAAIGFFARAIPALSVWGLLATITLISGLGLIRLRVRQTRRR